MFLWYGMGFTLYVTKMPERFFPKRYILVVVAVVVYIQCTVLMYSVYIVYMLLSAYSYYAVVYYIYYL